MDTARALRSNANGEDRDVRTGILNTLNASRVNILPVTVVAVAPVVTNVNMSFNSLRLQGG